MQNKNIPAALNAVAGQLTEYRAPGETIQTDTDCKLTYEILQWAKTHEDGTTDDRSIGTVEISRSNKENGAEYHILEKRSGGDLEIYEANVTTEKSDFGESIQNWTLSWHLNERPKERLRVSGKVAGKTLELDGTIGQKQSSVTYPVLCPWIMPFVLVKRGLDEQRSTEFTTVDELTYCKANQHLHGPDPIQSEINENPLLAFRHTGQATLPIHYVFDSQGRPVFVTFTMLSWILRTIDTSNSP